MRLQPQHAIQRGNGVADARTARLVSILFAISVLVIFSVVSYMELFYKK